MAGYRPKGMYMGDAWCVVHNGEVHLFHLQKKDENSSRTDLDARSIGRAVTKDLLHWEELPTVLPPNEEGTLDDLNAYTGCTVKADGKFYLFYTMRSKSDSGKVQNIGLAKSDDLCNWERYIGNPLFGPDPKYYNNKQVPLPNGIVDCRDFVVVKNPEDNLWYGFYAVRVPANTMCSGPAIAVSYSEDLITWTAMPPAFTTDRYGLIEVPDVFFLDGKWFMTFLVDTKWANRNVLEEAQHTCGTVYATADNIQGPYVINKDDYILMASYGITEFGNAAAYSLRSFEYNSSRLAICIESKSGTLSPVMQYCTDENGHLRIKYCDATQGYRKKKLACEKIPPALKYFPLSFTFQMPGGEWQLDENQYNGWADGWQAGFFDIESSDAEIVADVLLLSGAAGFAFGEWAFFIDVQRNEILGGKMPYFLETYSRKWPVEAENTYKLTVRIRKPRVEMYVDDILAVQFGADFAEEKSQIGLIVDRGKSIIKNLNIYEI